MKGIVAHIEGKYAVVLTQDGSFRKVRAKPFMSTGIEIDLDQPAEKVRNTRFVMKVTSIAAAALLTLGTAYGAYSYAMPYSYVHLDINPSVELTANIYDRIIKAEALNEDGRKLLEGITLKHTKIEAGISDLLGIAVDKGYLTESTLQADGTAPAGTDVTGTDTEGTAAEGAAGEGAEGQEEIENAVLLTVSSNNSKKSGELKKELINIASRELDTEKIDSEILVGEASMEQRNEAMELGVTPGKLVLIEDAMKAEPELQLEDLKRNTLKQLLKKIKEKDKRKQENSDNGTKSGVNGPSMQNPASDKDMDSSAQAENTAVSKSQGKGKGLNGSKSKKEQENSGDSVQAQSDEQTGESLEIEVGGTGLAAGTGENGKSVRNNGQQKNRGQNKVNNGDKDKGQDSSLAESLDKIQNEGTGGTKNKAGGGNQSKNKGEQVKSGVGSGNSKKIDDADRKTAGKDANELKIEREKLRKDLLDQMEKQLKERSIKSNGKNTGSENRKNIGSWNSNNNGKKR